MMYIIYNLLIIFLIIAVHCSASTRVAYTLGDYILVAYVIKNNYFIFIF